MRPFAVICMLALLLLPCATVAATLEDFLNAPVWYVRYEVSFKATYQGTTPVDHGSSTYTVSMERSFSATDRFNVRSQGPGSLSMNAMYGASSGKQPTVAEAQAMSMRMLENMETQANWIAMGAAADENPDIAASLVPTSPCRVDYTRVDVGKDLVGDLGEHFDVKTTTTVKGSGNVLALGMGALSLELDTKAKTYVFTLPMGFDAQGAQVKEDKVTILQVKGSPAQETRETKDVLLDYVLSGLELVDPTQSQMSGGVTIRGTLDAAQGKIAGEKSFHAHYKEHNVAVPGTLTYKYTLTMTPPPKVVKP